MIDMYDIERLKQIDICDVAINLGLVVKIRKHCVSFIPITIRASAFTRIINGIVLAAGKAEM